MRTAPTLGIDVEIVERNPAERGFVPQTKRWVVERTYGILMLHRRTPADEPDPRPAVPQHPAYQQVLAAFAEARNPLRARDLCQALDLDIVPKNIESTRHRLKRPVSRGILTESEPGLFTLLRT